MQPVHAAAMPCGLEQALMRAPLGGAGVERAAQVAPPCAAWSDPRLMDEADAWLTALNFSDGKSACRTSRARALQGGLLHSPGFLQLFWLR